MSESNDILPHIMENNRLIIELKEGQARLETEVKHINKSVNNLGPRVVKLEHDQTKRNAILHAAGVVLGIIGGFIGSILQGKT